MHAHKSFARGLFLASIALPAFAAPIFTEQLSAYAHYNGGLQTVLGTASQGYFSNFDAENLGDFGWTFTNTTGASLQNLQFLVFLDADIDRDSNTFFNEYGEFIGLTLPVFAPVGSIAANSWEIDEPGLLFGNILLNLAAGSLDNSNGVPSSAPDDVSLALGFNVGTLGPNQTLVTRFSINRNNLGGLRQIDPDSSYDFYLNGYAAIQQDQGPPSEVPEPATWKLLAPASLALAWRKVRKS